LSLGVMLDAIGISGMPPGGSPDPLLGHSVALPGDELPGGSDDAGAGPTARPARVTAATIPIGIMRVSTFVCVN
jgi:hypothetical protein